ncbi:MAG TPA: oligopeptide:H+ symporter, partial [Verrucomicrobium sp.]|nr:oligopeptide:H+ symporter [Verrucomicrobium sp.]
MTSLPDTSSAPAKHPRGIYTLFFTEMWERMSYYGMRALLILYMTALPAKGGMGLPDKVAAAIYGLYVCGVYLVALPGGWIADRLISPRNAVLYGGIIIAMGHLTLAVPGDASFFGGLLLVVLGTALLKPCASSLVGQLYPEGGARRDAGFTLFYMGVNVGGFLGPIVCSYLGERWNWHWGFAAAGVGMIAGVIQFALTQHHMGDAGIRPAHPSATPKRHWTAVGVALAGVLLVAGLAMSGLLVINPVVVAKFTSLVLGLMAVGWFAWTFAFGGLTTDEKKRLGVLAILFVASAVFWSGFEQAGSSMNLFAERFTDRQM